MRIRFAKPDGDAFRAYLRNLPNEIAQAADAGLPIVLSVEQPLPPHAQRLMDSLGVDVIVTEPAGAVTCPVKLCGWVYDGPADEADEWLAAHLKLMHASPRAGLGERAVRSSGPDTARSPSVARRRQRGEVTPERRQLAERALALRAEGKLQREVADALGVSRSYAADLMGHDPLGEKSRVRKESYQGVCVDCAGPTSGSKGPNKQPQRCLDCQLVWRREQKTWTPEAIVDAVQRWAADHNGRPPTVAQWMPADPDRGYPSATACYGPTRNDRFANWADVIEAAGFPRPYSGTRLPKGEGRTHNMVRSYVVLHRNGDGGWHEIPVEAFNEVTAIEKAATEPGEYVAIRADVFRRRTVAPVTRMTVQETAAVDG